MYETLNPPARVARPGVRHHRTVRTLALVIGGALTVLATGAPGAYAAEGPLSKRVSYADLNLRSPQGRVTLVRRVKFAARQVCEAETLQPTLTLRRDRVCIAKTMESAMAQVERAFEVAALTQ